MAKTGVKKDNKTLDIRTVCECCHCLGSKTLHPQVSLINLEKPELEEDAVKFEFYAILLIEDCPDGCCCCGRKYYDYSVATMVFLTPGEIFRMSKEDTLPPRAGSWHSIPTCCSAPRSRTTSRIILSFLITRKRRYTSPGERLPQ